MNISHLNVDFDVVIQKSEQKLHLKFSKEFHQKLQIRSVSDHVLLRRLVESLVAGELLAGWQTSMELYLLHLDQVWIRSDRLVSWET